MVWNRNCRRGASGLHLGAGSRLRILAARSRGVAQLLLGLSGVGLGGMAAGVGALAPGRDAWPARRAAPAGGAPGVGLALQGGVVGR
jgi:hypothetical protein